MSVTVKRVAETESLELSEGPHWDADTQSLYSVNIYEKTIHRYVPATKQFTSAVIRGTKAVSFIIPIEGAKNKFIISQGRKLVAITWDGVSETVSDAEELAEVDNEPDKLENQINDAKADASGRLWFGTVRLDPTVEGYAQANKGSLYSFGPQRVIKKHISGLTMSNGITFNEVLKKLYFIDSIKRNIFQFDFDGASGIISNQEIIFTLNKHNIPGTADGQAIDTDGNLWIAIFSGSRVIKIDPRKPETLLQTIEIPVAQVTSVAFGGPNLDELYVTTARITIKDRILEPSEGHGYMFKVTGTGAKGYPGVKVKL